MLSRMVMVVLAWVLLGWSSALQAQQTYDKKKADDLIRSAEQAEMQGYILAGVGILLILAAIPYAIYADRKKKARRSEERRKEARSASEGPS